MPGIGIISNKNARLNKLYPKLRDRMAFMLGRGGEVVSTGSLDDAHKAISEFKRVDADMVAISGGDGTAHRTIEVLIEIYGSEPLPPVLLLPTGTQNMVPNSFGIRDSGVATLLMALARYRHNIPIRCVRRNMLKVNGRYSFMFAVGLASRFLKNYYDGDTTPLGAAKLIGEYMISILKGSDMAKDAVASFPLEYRIDEGPVMRAETHSVYCSFIEELSLRFKPFPRAGWDEGVFETVVIEGSPWDFSKQLPRIWMGSYREMGGFHRAMARNVEMKLGHPEPFALDGEVYEATDTYTISAGPEIRFVVPGLKLLPMDSRIRVDKVGPWDMQFIV